MKKSASLLLVMIMVAALFLAACSSNNEGGNEGGDGGGAESAGNTQDSNTENTDNAKENSDEPKETVEVTLAGWAGNTAENEALKRVIEAFEAEHSHIKVKQEAISDQYMNVITTRLIGGTGPDVFYLDVAEVDKMVPRNVLEPLAGYIKPDFEIDDFYPDLLNGFKSDGTIYGIPKDFNTLALFINVQAFKDAGLVDADGNVTAPKTWDEFVEYAKKLTLDKNGDGITDQYGVNIQADLARMIPNIMAYGGNVVDEEGYPTFADPDSLKGLAEAVAMHRDGIAGLPGDAGASWPGEGFANGSFAMAVTGGWTVGFLDQNFPEMEYQVAELPTQNGKANTMAYTVAYVMNAKSKEKEAAWELLSYLTGKEGMKLWTEGGVALPSRKSLAGPFEEDPKRKAFFAGAEYATPWRIGPYQSTISTNFNNMITSVMQEGADLEEAMKEAQRIAAEEIKAAQ